MKRKRLLAALLVICVVFVSGCGLRKVDDLSATTTTNKQVETSATTKKNVVIPTTTPVSTAEVSKALTTVPTATVPATTVSGTGSDNLIPGGVTYDGFTFVVPEIFGSEAEDSEYENKYYYVFSPSGEFTMLHFFILDDGVDLQSESFEDYARYFYSGFSEPNEMEWDFEIQDLSNAYVGIKKAAMVYFPENGQPHEVVCYLIADLEDGRLINVNMMQQQGTAYDLVPDVELMVRGVVVESMTRDQTGGDFSLGSNQELQGIRSEFQQKVDESLAFVLSYCDFMKKFKASSNPTAMMTEYNAFVQQYQSLMEELGALINENLSTEEINLYIYLMEKISEMLSELQ